MSQIASHTKSLATSASPSAPIHPITTSRPAYIIPHNRDVGVDDARSRALPPTRPVSTQSTSALHDAVRSSLLPPGSKLTRLRNWGGTFHAQPQRVFSPTSVEQCCAIVELARREGKELRAVGKMHSPSDLMFTKQWAIRMEGLQGMLDLDHSKPSITALAGTFVWAVHQMLDSAEPPLAMTNLGSISEQTMGGLVATASHGTGVNFPVISTMVESLQLVLPLAQERGGTQVVRCSRTEWPQLFNASLCGLGLTGLIVAVELRVGPAFRLRDVAEDCPVDFVFGPKTGCPTVAAAPIDDADRLRHRKSRGKLSTGQGSTVSSLPSPTSGVPRPARHSVGWLLAHGHRLPAAEPDLLPSARNPDPSQLWPAPSVRVPPSVQADEDDAETREAQRRLETIVESAQHVRMMWFPQARMVTVRRANRTAEPPVQASMAARIKHRVVGYHLTQLLLFLSRYHSELPPRVARLVFWMTHPRGPFQDASTPQAEQQAEEMPDAKTELASFTQGKTALSITSATGSSTSAVDVSPAPLHASHPCTVQLDTSYRVFNMDCLFPQYTDEWAIPYERSAACLRAMREWLEEEERLSEGERIHFPVEVRWTDADGIWLSHCQGRKSCFIGVIQFRPYNQPVRYRSLFAKYESLMRHYGGRPHWAKAHTCGIQELSRLYPHLNDFLALRREVDAEGVFLNAYTRRHLLGEMGEAVGGRVFKSRL